MEFKLMHPVQEQDLSNAMIKFNNEELAKEILERTKKYNSIVYNDKNIGQAKEDRATLRKFVTALEDRRKAVKKEYLKPYEEFESKVKELVALVEKPINMIDVQIEEYEEQKRKEKRMEIDSIYLSNIGNLKELLPLSKIWNDRWLNITYRIADIRHEIEETVDKVRDDIAVIIDLGSQFELQIKDKYLQTLDLSAALKEKTRLEDQQEKIKAYQEAEEEKKALEDGTHEETSKTPSKELLEAHTGQGEVPKPIDFRVWVTKAQKEALGKFLIDNKIKVGRVE